MEYNKVKSFWNEKHGVSTSSTTTKRNTNNNSNTNTEETAQLEVLEEIKPEITSEGYGLRTPYGTHLNLDFVKYCEDLTSGHYYKKSFAKPRRRTTSSAEPTKRNFRPSRLSGGPSSESLDFTNAEEFPKMAEDSSSESNLMETRRRLEAFRSFRSRRFKSSTENMLNPPIRKNSDGYGTTESFKDAYNHSGSGKNGYGASANGRMENISSCGSSSGSTTPNSVSGLPPNHQATPQHLQLVREQMASALVRLRELEEQVKSIPVLQVKISVLQQEKRHLIEQLKLQESQETYANSHWPRSPQKSTLFSSSSGFSSSFQSNSSFSPGNGSSTQSAPLQQSSESFGSSKSGPPPPPPPPKRKYRSIGAGSEIPVDEIVCFRRGDDSPDNLTSQHKASVNFGSIVKQIDIDAAYNIFPPAPKQYSDASVSTNSPKMASCALQTENIESGESWTQTKQTLHKDAKCDPIPNLIQTRDSSCDALSTSTRDVSVMTVSHLVETTEQWTSSRDLIQLESKKVGIDIQSISVGIVTEKVGTATKETSCNGMVRCHDARIGPDYMAIFRDVSTSTSPRPTMEASVDCCMPLNSSKVFLDKMTSTLSSTGHWVTYSDRTSVACGSDCSVDKTTGTKSTNTEKAFTKEKGTETVQILHLNKSTIADVRPPTNHISTNTVGVPRYNQSTDCSDIRPVLRHNATNTSSVKTKTSYTQYAINKANLVETMTNTDVITFNNATTSTDDLENTRNIDAYVDKVQSLLEEQQSLLAENYGLAEVIDEQQTCGLDEVSGKTDKVSRFVNPFFTGSDEEKTQESVIETNSASSPAIYASLSLLKSQKDACLSSSEYDSDSSDESIPAEALRPLPSLDSDFELKSIMKKPGTPSGTKKCLRFAEGVKSGDDSSTEESSDESEEETDAKEKVDKIVIKLESPMKEKKVEIPKKEIKIVKPESVEEKQHLNYSNEFVKKPSEPKLPIEEKIETHETEAVEIVVEEPVVEEHVEISPQPSQPCIKYIFTTTVLDACDVLEKHLRNPKSINKSDLATATSIVQQEWFRVAAQTDSSKRLLDDFVSDLADTSLLVLRKVVNMTDASGNTVLHYAISHGNVTIVDSLLSIEELDVDKTNQAGFTPAMLAALCDITSDIEMKVFKKLFANSNVNTHAKEAGQTALMLAVSHGRLHTAQLLLNHGADLNARDEDGSTAIMCAVEHGELEAVKLLLSKPNCDATIADNDGSTALSIAMERGHREIALLLYAQLNLRSNARQPRPRTACKSMIPSPIQRTVKL